MFEKVLKINENSSVKVITLFSQLLSESTVFVHFYFNEIFYSDTRESERLKFSRKFSCITLIPVKDKYKKSKRADSNKWGAKATSIN